MAGSDQVSVSPTVVDFGNVPLLVPSTSQATLTGAFYLTNGGNSATTITTSTATPNPAFTPIYNSVAVRPRNRHWQHLRANSDSNTRDH